MKLAIRGHDLGKKGEFNLVERLDEFGFDGVQLVPYKTYADVNYDASVSEARASEIAAELKAAGKEIFMLGAYFNPVHSVKEKVENGVATFKRYIELAGIFGCGVVGSETGSFNDDKWTYNPLNRTDEALDTVIETFGNLAEYAEKFNVDVGIEGAAGHVCWNPKRLKLAADEIGRKNVKFIFDLFNYLDETNFCDYLDILKEGLDIFGDRIHCFHVKDCRPENGKPKRVAIGSGIFDYEKILPLIKKSNENAILIFEGSTGEEIPQGVKIIQKIWSEI